MFYLTYEELRILSANASAFDGKALVKQRRPEREKAFRRRLPDWAGTIPK